MEQSRHIDVEMFDDSASEVSYASNQRAPPYQMQYRPYPAPINSPLRNHEDEDSGRARPGRPPARADSELTQEELKRRNRRRQRNREAAQRCRQRRLDQIDVLKDEVDKLKKDAADTNQMNTHLKSELRKLRFQLDLYEKNVGPLSQLTAQQHQYARPHPMLVSQPIKIEQPQMTSALETQATQSVAPIAVQPQNQLPQQETVPTVAQANTSATPPSVSTNTSPSVPAALPSIISPYPGGLMPLISPVNGMVFAFTPTQGMLTPSIITPTLKHGEFFFPDLEKARNESVTELSKIAQKITANQAGTSAVEDVSSIDEETIKARENKEDQQVSDKETN